MAGVWDILKNAKKAEKKRPSQKGSKDEKNRMDEGTHEVNRRVTFSRVSRRRGETYRDRSGAGE